jgi:L-amino acid N-acyltransferase YncA
MSLVIRASREADLPAITAIYAHAVRHGTASFELEPPSAEDMAGRRRTLLEGSFPYLVAEQDGAVQGYAYAGPYRPRPAYRSTVEDSVYVAPDAQGRGVGGKLLGRLIAACEALDFRLMVAVIGDEASAGSIRLDERLGFVRAGVIPGIGFKHGRWLSTVLMHRGLGPGPAKPPTRPIR